MQKRMIMLTWMLIIMLGGMARAEIIMMEPVKDNMLIQTNDGSLSNGAGDYFFAGVTGSRSIRRGVIAFDIAANIPQGSVINSVSLMLTMSITPGGVGEVPIRIHRLLADWGEGTSDATLGEGRGDQATVGDVTWLHTFFPDHFWAMAGGDFDPTESASTQVGGIGEYAWGSTAGMVADVQAWLDNPSMNFGWILIGTENISVTSAKRFNSVQNPDASSRPMLVVDYTPVAGEACVQVTDTVGIPVSCAQFQGAFFSFTLDFAPNPALPDDLIWMMDFGSLNILESPADTLCIPVGNDASIPVSCAEFQGIQFEFVLRLLPIPEDPDNLFWRMDFDSLIIN